jgi:uncharacterized alkaline shock family protein YloU
VTARPAGPGGGEADVLPPPGERGATVVPGKVVARIAGRAAHEALARQGGAAAALDLRAPRSTAAVYDGSTRLTVSLDLPYPLDIARTAREVRHHVAERVAGLTGLDVDDVTVSVRRLVPDETLRRERVR